GAFAAGVEETGRPAVKHRGDRGWGMDRRVVPGLVLIALGVLFLLFQQVGVGGEAVVAVIGLVLLAGYAYTRNYGFLIPGGIMTGLGMGIILAARSPGGGSAGLLGLGVGFFRILCHPPCART